MLFRHMPGSDFRRRAHADAARARPTSMQTVDDFLEQWRAHGHPLTSARDLRYDRFLFIGVDESTEGASGCSVDALVRDIKRVEGTLGLTLVDRSPVLHREGDAIVRLPRDEFAERARTGAITPDTVVFNNTLTRVEDLKNDRWRLRPRSRGTRRRSSETPRGYDSGREINAESSTDVNALDVKIGRRAARRATRRIARVRCRILRVGV